jgi:hypothetical protein
MEPNIIGSPRSGRVACSGVSQTPMNQRDIQHSNDVSSAVALVFEKSSTRELHSYVPEICLSRK